jgi:hypothetical protein
VNRLNLLKCTQADLLEGVDAIARARRGARRAAAAALTWASSAGARKQETAPPAIATPLFEGSCARRERLRREPIFQREAS